MSWIGQVRWRAGSAGSALRDCLERELAERAGFHWLAVVFGAGALVYFTLPREPLLSMLLTAALVASSTAAVCYHRGKSCRVVTVVAMCLAGAAGAKLRVERVQSPHLQRDLVAEMSGRVVSREARVEFRPRIVIDRLESPDISPQEMPRRLRVTLGRRHEMPPLGSRITVLARLMPVPGPVVPGGYDPRRAAFFAGIGGSGFVLGSWRLGVDREPDSVDLTVARIRAAAVARITAAEPGEAGAVAAALLVGERSGLSEATNESLRISGLAHILAISGLHMMLVAGTAFFAVRAGLALSPRLALARPIRKWAALAAILVATIYLALSGGSVATVRAYVMAVVMFSAMLVDRPAISMRNLAIAAFIVVALKPEGVIEPGFQMSFGAVMALIAAWEFWGARRIRRLGDGNILPGPPLLGYARRAILGVAITTLVAGFATAPFAAYHFERVATYSLLGNLLAAPLVSTLIMPFGLAALILMPFGLEGPPLWVMARGIEALIAVSDWVARLPGSEFGAPPIASLSLLLIVAGMLWLCLWRLRWRMLGLPLIGLGLLSIPILKDLPDVLVAPDGKAVAVRDSTGVLRVSGSRTGSYTIDQFFDEEPGPPPEDGSALREGVGCDPLGCILKGANGLTVAHVLDPAAFPEDCRRADVIVAPLPAPGACSAALVIDAPRLARFGSHAVRAGYAASERQLRVRSERSQFARPWQAVSAAGRDAAVSTSE
ncbi:MAG TPA: ComEC/Rec2 family competence protein, partial [Propylenella sp.]